jgi:hypothetical protein
MPYSALQAAIDDTPSLSACPLPTCFPVFFGRTVLSRTKCTTHTLSLQ